MNIRNFILFAVLCFAFVGAACRRAQTQTEAAPDAKRYELNGTIVSVDAAKRKAKVEHDEIKGYMPAMTMDFPIKQDWVIRELQPNQKIAATLVVEPKGDYFLDEVRIMQTSDAPAAAPQAEPNAEKIGVRVPNFELTNQDNKKIGFNDFAGKNLIVTFIFTRCPDAEMCPQMSINFSDLAGEIEKSPELAENTRLLSVTFDPQHDTPQVLRNYGAGYFGKDAKPNFQIWQLATGTPEEIKNVTDFFGVTTMKENETIVHNLRTIIIAPDGKIRKIIAGNLWKPADIIKELQNQQT